MRETDSAIDEAMAAVAAGDRAAFRTLHTLAAPVVYGVCLRILRQPDRAEDAAQATFLKVWRAASSFDRSRGSAMGWICVIARRCALDLVGPERNFEPLESVDVPAPEALSEPRLARAFETLSEQHRSALLLAYIYGLTHEEIAVRLDVPLGTAKTWVRRGLILLRERLCL